MSEIITGIEIMAVGFTVVMVILYLLCLVIQAVSYVLNKFTQNEIQETKLACSAQDSTTTVTDGQEELVILTAAVAMYLEK